MLVQIILYMKSCYVIIDELRAWGGGGGTTDPCPLFNCQILLKEINTGIVLPSPITEPLISFWYNRVYTISILFVVIK